MEINYITVDFWNTIFRSNPDYAVARDEAVWTYLESKGVIKDLTIVGDIYKETKEFCNMSEFTTGLSIPIETKHHLFFRKLGAPLELVNEEYFSLVENLFLKYPLIPVHKDVLSILNDLQHHYNMTILSNSGMVRSKVLHPLLKLEHTGEYYTDSNMYCKPNEDCFNDLLSDISSTNIIRYEKWLHIGDSHIHDIAPVKGLGGKAFQIKTEQDWENLKNILL